MKRLTVAFLLLVAYPAAAQIRVVSVREKDIPKTMKFEGAFKEAIRYTDKDGVHVVITAEAQDDENDQRTGYVFAYNYLQRGNAVSLVWKVYDHTAACGEDAAAEFKPNTLGVTDLNKNGVAEVWLMYYDACKGDVSPSTLKIIMHEGGKKFAVRGSTRVKVNATEYLGGEYAFDEAFKAAPASYRNYALKLWKKHVNEDHFY